MSARNLGEARASLDEARVLLLRREKSAPYPGEGCLPPLVQVNVLYNHLTCHGLMGPQSDLH